MSTSATSSAEANAAGGSILPVFADGRAAYIGRFLEHWRPDMVVLARAELWPNVLMEAGGRDLPVIFVNARMSDRIYGYCRRLRGHVGELMGPIDLCLARADTDAERFVELGASSRPSARTETCGRRCCATEVAIPLHGGDVSRGLFHSSGGLLDSPHSIDGAAS